MGINLKLFIGFHLDERLPHVDVALLVLPHRARLHVLPQLALVSSGERAVSADVRLDARMPVQQMRDAVARLRERLVAHATLERSFARVNSRVRT